MTDKDSKNKEGKRRIPRVHEDNSIMKWYNPKRNKKK